jgi:hypothetical protein
MGMADPFPEEASMCVDLYLERQEAGAQENQLNCLFCGRGHDVLWQTTLNLGTGTRCTVGVCESCRTKLKPKKAPAQPDGFVHVDDFIDNHFQPAYARFVLDHFRRSAVCHMDFQPFMEKHLLFCTYQDKRYRVTGASRLGDIWLSADFKREVGYEHRVNVADCTEWSGQP